MSRRVVRASLMHIKAVSDDKADPVQLIMTNGAGFVPGPPHTAKDHNEAENFK